MKGAGRHDHDRPITDRGRNRCEQHRVELLRRLVQRRPGRGQGGGRAASEGQPANGEPSGVELGQSGSRGTQTYENRPSRCAADGHGIQGAVHVDQLDQRPLAQAVDQFGHRQRTCGGRRPALDGPHQTVDRGLECDLAASQGGDVDAGQRGRLDLGRQPAKLGQIAEDGRILCRRGRSELQRAGTESLGPREHVAGRPVGHRQPETEGGQLGAVARGPGPELGRPQRGPVGVDDLEPSTQGGAHAPEVAVELAQKGDRVPRPDPYRCRAGPPDLGRLLQLGPGGPTTVQIDGHPTGQQPGLGGGVDPAAALEGGGRAPGRGEQPVGSFAAAPAGLHGERTGPRRPVRRTLVAKRRRCGSGLGLGERRLAGEQRRLGQRQPSLGQVVGVAGPLRLLDRERGRGLGLLAQPGRQEHGAPVDQPERIDSVEPAEDLVDLGKPGQGGGQVTGQRLQPGQMVEGVDTWRIEAEPAEQLFGGDQLGPGSGQISSLQGQQATVVARPCLPQPIAGPVEDRESSRVAGQGIVGSAEELVEDGGPLGLEPGARHTGEDRGRPVARGEGRVAVALHGQDGGQAHAGLGCEVRQPRSVGNTGGPS